MIREAISELWFGIALGTACLASIGYVSGQWAAAALAVVVGSAPAMGLILVCHLISRRTSH